MNRSPARPERVVIQLVPDPNPWDDAAALPLPARPLRLILPLLLALFSLYQLGVAVTLPAGATALVTLLGALTVLLVLRSVAASAVSLLTFVGGALIGGWAGGAYALCLLLSLTLGAYLICALRSRYLILVPIVCYLAALLWCRDAALSVLPLLTFPAAGLLAYTTMKNDGRVSAIVAGSAMLALCGALGLGLVWNARLGTPLTPAALLELLLGVREELLSLLLQNEYIELFEQSFGEYLAALGLSATAVLTATVEQLFNLLPAIVLLAINMLSFSAQLCCTAAFHGTGLSALITRTSRLFIMSTLSAVLFLVCSVALFFSSAQTLALAVMQNLQLVLFPGMCLIGAYKLLADATTRRSPLMIGLIVAAALFATGLLVWALAFSGALTTLLRPLLTRMLLLSGKPDNKGNDGDDHKDQDSNHSDQV